jgi:ABC-type polysaccharide/polyol phosphate transport system ATPase subunit
MRWGCHLATVAVENLCKRFRIPHEKRRTLLDHAYAVTSLLGGRPWSYEEFWALKGVTFSIQPGESLGIVGPNGSGKSTLLKLLAGIMKPDSGTISVEGRLAQIMELGIGFHADLTVRENATVYGVLMGIPRGQMRQRIDSILGFADLGKFQDSKLSHLSSGMQVRLGFAIAVETEADIFLIDEALAVGDAEFQEKCLEKFKEFKKAGKTIVLASHAKDTLRAFCEKTLYLLHGEVRSFGATEESLNRYVADAHAGLLE